VGNTLQKYLARVLPQAIIVCSQKGKMKLAIRELQRLAITFQCGEQPVSDLGKDKWSKMISARCAGFTAQITLF
jgi:hypothetical protein